MQVKRNFTPVNFIITHTLVTHIHICRIKWFMKFLTQCSLIFYVPFYSISCHFWKLFSSSINLIHGLSRVKIYNLKDIDKDSIGFSDKHFLKFLFVCFNFRDKVREREKEKRQREHSGIQPLERDPSWCPLEQWLLSTHTGYGISGGLISKTAWAHPSQ